MTPEGVVMILILSFAFLKFIQDQKMSLGITPIKEQIIAKSSIEPILFFAVSTAVGLTVTNLIVGLVLINSIAWMAYHVFLRSLGYSIISWLSLVIFWVFAHATYISFERIPFTEIWYYTLFSWQVALLIVLLYDTLGKHIKILPSLIVWIASSLVLLVPLTFTIYKLSFNLPIKTSQLNAIYQTDYYETLNFLNIYIPPIYLVLFLIILFGLLGILLYQEFNNKKRIETKTFFQLTIALLILANLNVLQNLLMPMLVIDSAKTYAKELAVFKKEQQKRKIGEIKFEATKEKGKELYIFIIGESLNKHHMSLYGYHRNTTPQLDQLYKDSSIVKFDEAFSNHVHTVEVLIQSLTQSNQLNKTKYSTSPSIIDILEKADFDTYWISNQVVYGGWDNPVSVIAERADQRFNFNSNVGKITNTIVLDENLVTKMEEIVSKSINKNTAIFLHLMGNHFDYRDRYSDDYKQFTETLYKKSFGKNKYLKHYVNAYDNSVLYNDYLVSRVINFLEKRKGISSCLYFADHSEDVLPNLSHNESYFNFNMIEIPMIMWFSEEYKTEYQEKYDRLKSRKSQLFSNGLIYETLIGMTGINTDQYSAQYDLFSDSYDLPIEQCFTLHGQRKVSDKQNYNYHQRRNNLILDSLGLLSKVYPHRVNTIGKLKSVVYSGSNSFEVDVIFKSGEESDYFEVGHDEGALSGMSLEELLSQVEKDQIQKIWLDIKNLNEENLSALSKRLILLDEKFDIKEKAIIESSFKKPSFAELSKLGFHTSYYLPTGIKNTDQKEYPKIAARISQQIKNQEIKAISFDISLYPFVKDYLEKSIPNDVVFHTWDLGFQLRQPQMIKKLRARKYFNDSRIKSILVAYHSQFEL